MEDDRTDADVDAIGKGEDDPRLDELFGVLSNPLARYTVSYLSERPETTLDELADVVTGAEATTREAIGTPADRERVRIRLYHVVLPKLEAAGFVEFDPDGKRIARSNIPPRVYEFLGVED